MRDKKDNLYSLVEVTYDEKQCHENVILKFRADSFSKAEKYKQDFINSLSSKPEYSNINPENVYWEKCLGSYVMNEDGTETFYEDFKDILEDHTLKEKIYSFFRYTLKYYFYDKFRSKWFKYKDRKFLLKNEYAKSAEWDLPNYLMKVASAVLPKLAECKHSIPEYFIIKAEEQLSEKKADIPDGFKGHSAIIVTSECKDKKDDVKDRAINIVKKIYNEIVLHAKLYDFYKSYGISDDIEFEKEWKHTIPYAKGSCRTFDSDGYKKLNELAKNEWNKFWDMMKEYGELMWD